MSKPIRFAALYHSIGFCSAKEGTWRGICTCGWPGVPRLSAAEAEEDGHSHAMESTTTIPVTGKR